MLLGSLHISSFGKSMISCIILTRDTVSSRFNIAADLMEQATNAGELGLAAILVWMRFMATRQLIWNKNYNVKPR